MELSPAWHGGTTPAVSLRQPGTGFIFAHLARSFRFIREADAYAVLCYKDHDPGDARGAKFARIAAVLKRPLAEGVLVHGVGLQMHCNVRKPPVRAAIPRSLERCGALGLRVQITELDVALAGAPGTLEERREEQAEVYRDVVTAAVGSKAGAAIVPWGFSDKFIQRGLNIRHLLPENTPTPLGLFDAA